jgi:hypothetical protein
MADIQANSTVETIQKSKFRPRAMGKHLPSPSGSANQQTAKRFYSSPAAEA